MTIPPYIPGTVLVATAVGSAVMAIADLVDPSKAGAWTDRGVILAYAAIATIGIAWMGKWVATTLLKALQANTKAMEDNTASNKEVIKYFETVSKEAVRVAMDKKGGER